MEKKKDEGPPQDLNGPLTGSSDTHPNRHGLGPSRETAQYPSQSASRRPSPSDKNLAEPEL
jgi:hypothetical protein